MNNDLLYQVALTQVQQIGDVHTRILINTFGEAAAIFKAPLKKLETIEGIGRKRAQAIKSFHAFPDCEKELAFIEKYKIRPLFITDDNYPKRLLNCYDSPSLLYFRGTANLNAAKILSIVGTRSHSEYGKQVCEKLLAELEAKDILIVSGLAFGIDTIAHRNALKNGFQTVGVLAHGLDRIYPSQNKFLAKQMLEYGGLLTDFKSETNPDKQNFPKRNRIVAGLCDALIVVESSVKGGSIITAELANSYNKDVMAYPGRSNDIKSEGCNFLIRKNKASLVTSAADIMEMMNWDQPVKPKVAQRELFSDLNTEEQLIVNLLAIQPTHIDELYVKTNLSSSTTANALLMLEMRNIISALPGKIYQLC
ncbi:MAG: dprA [Ferruginibacter sp.]|nr:dprA [Ferruginibacter sp.]